MSSKVAKAAESGFALLLALFMVASLILLAAIATPRILTQGRREKEQEAIWRGNQYMRAIRLYYRKNGRYPQTLEDLKKPDNVGNHYLRKPYADPINAGDGAWRVIYVTPSGQLVGSIHYHSLQEMAMALVPGFQAAGLPGAAQSGQAGPQQGSAQAGPQTGQPSGAPPAQAGATPGPISQPQGANEAANQTSGQTSSQTTTQGFNQGDQGFASQGFSSAQPASLAPLEAVDGPVMGAFAIGVASKIKQPSLLVYRGQNTYFGWEFIYNPLLAGPAAGQQQNGVQPSVAGAPGTSPPAGATQTLPTGANTGIAPSAAGASPQYAPVPVGGSPANPPAYPPDTPAVPSP
jgi:type II secretory pathway pseudopilin PulG